MSRGSTIACEVLGLTLCGLPTNCPIKCMFPMRALLRLSCSNAFVPECVSFLGEVMRNFSASISCQR